MASFVLSGYAAFILLFMIALMIISITTRTAPWTAVSYLKDPLFVALATHSGEAAIPAAIRAMRDNFKLDGKMVDILVPLGTILGQYSNVLYFSFISVFIAQFYGVSLDLGDYLFITFMSLLASLSAIGASGALSLPLVGLILEPLGIPISGIIVLLIAVDPLMDFALSVIRVQTNCAAVALIAPKQTYRV